MYLFRSRINRHIFGLALPIFLAMINHTAIAVADTAMVGTLGPIAIGATGLGGVIYMTVLAFLMGGSFGVQIVVARHYGEGNFPMVLNTLRSSLQIAVPVGILLSVGGYYLSPLIVEALQADAQAAQLSSDYVSIRFAGTILFILIFVLRGFLDGLGQTTAGMISAFASTSTNIFLNWILIYGNLGFPAMGVKGAALASALSGFVGLLAFIPHLMRQSNRRFLTFRLFDLNMSSLPEVGKMGFAPAIEGAITNISFVLFIGIAAHSGVSVLAASNVVFAIISLSFMPGFAFGVAATTILGQAIGRRQFRLGYIGSIRAAHFSAFLMGIMGIAFIVFSTEALTFFTDDADVLREAYPALVMISLAQPFDAYHMVIGSALRSAGFVYFVLKAYAICSYLVMLPLAYFLSKYFQLGALGLWGTIVIWLFCLAVSFLWKFRKQQWVKESIA